MRLPRKDLPRLPTCSRLPRRDVLSFAALACAIPAPLLAPGAAYAGVGTRYNPGENAEELSAAVGGLKPGTGRPLNALSARARRSNPRILVST